MTPCIIIEDEPLGAGILAEYVQMTKILKLLGQFQLLSEAWQAISQNPGALIYIDINFKGVNVNREDIAHILSFSSRIVFVTAYPKNHLIVKNLIISEDLGYLQKPFSYNTFHFVLNQVLSIREEKKNTL